MTAAWREAPLYVEVHDVAVYVTARATSLPPESGLPARMTAASLDLLDAVALGLTFPDDRAAYLRRADEALVRLRMALRVARDLGLLAPSQVRHVQNRLVVAGRQLGGWRRTTDRRDSGKERHGPPERSA